MGLLALSFLAGILTVLSPCVLPLLPVIVGGSMAGGRSARRAATVAVALGVSVFLFTFLLKVSTALITIPPVVWNILSGGIIFIIGIFFLFPKLWDVVPGTAKANRDSTKLMSHGFMRQDFWGDLIVGAALGPVFSTCSPTYFIVLASVLPVSLAKGATDILAYVIGLCLFLFIISFAGQKLLNRFNIAANPESTLRRGIGILFAIIGLAIALGFAQKFELAYANVDIFNLSNVEQGFLSGIRSAAPAGSAAPEIASPANFINTGGQPISIGQYKGKDVVLVDFWDYSCINCEREIPYVEAWWQKYHGEGLVVIGVHTPEFAFEKLQSNVQAAVTSLGITYPVVLDNDYATWNAFGNEYWPQIYLIDADGNIVYSHSGEGEYAQTEAAIQNALAARDQELNLPDTVSSGTVNPEDAVKVNAQELGSPETYFGAERNQYLGDGTPGTQGPQTLSVPASPTLDTLYLGGLWNFYPEYAETSDTNAKIVYQFDAKEVYMVATGNPSAKVKVLLDGVPIPSADAGADVSAGGTVTVDADRLYKLVNLPNYGVHTLEIDVKSGTLDAYTFTFG